MNSSLFSIPEISALSSRKSIMRIPPETDVPLTPRVVSLIDSAAFRRLSHVCQLGLVPLVYPGARHTRFEHSLGVYRTSLLFLQRLADDPRFAAAISSQQAELFIATALLHDVGHTPYCHLIEDMRLPGSVSHEENMARNLENSEIADILEKDWRISPRDVALLLTWPPQPGNNTLPKSDESSLSLLSSLLSGPIDIDKMDYLYRDSLHAGVPYGRHFDRERLIGSLCLNESGNRLAISEKGKTAAELMVFARYVMFSEVYWHHTVRSATAMLQRAVFLLWDTLDWSQIKNCSDAQFQELLLETAKRVGSSAAQTLLEGLFGDQREIYKGVREFSILQEPEIVKRLARQPFDWLVRCCKSLAEALSKKIGQPVSPDWILIDAPPVTREVQFKVDIFSPKEGKYRPLQQVSPVVNSLAMEQFDDFVKRVRIFAAKPIASALKSIDNWNELLETAAEQTR